MGADRLEGPDPAPADDVVRLRDENAALRERLNEQERELAAIYDAVPVGLCLLDHELRYVRLNQRLADMNGLPLEAHLGRHPHELLPELGARLEKQLAEVLSTGRPLQTRVVGTTPAAPQLQQTWLVQWTPIADDEGHLLGISAAAEPLNDRVRAEDALRASEARYRAFFQNVQEYVILGAAVRDASGRIVDWQWRDVNEPVLRLTGLRRDEIVGQRGAGPVASSGGAWPNEELTQVLESGRPMSFEGAYFGRNFSVQIFALPGDQVAVAALDITDRTRVEESLREADRRKDDFLAVLSHELRNPLAPIRNSLFVLERDRARDPRNLRAVEVISRQVGHLARLVDDLLDVTRISRGKVRLVHEPLDLAELVERSVEDLGPQFQAAGVAVEVHEPSSPPWVYGDSARLTQVVANLLENAAKFTPRGGRVDVRLGNDPARGQATLDIADTGVGIEPALLEHLFQPFSQADRSLDRSKGGLGLGLALVKGLVELHGGEVRATSDGAGRGAAFHITLPLLATHQDAGTGPRAAAPGQPLRVLVIEDNRDSADSLRDALELFGHEVIVAYDGPEGLATARSRPPDVVICDIGLPGMSGFEVAHAFRADPLLRHAYLIALTGYISPEDQRRAVEAGFDRHLAKPADLDALQSAVESTAVH